MGKLDSGKWRNKMIILLSLLTTIAQACTEFPKDGPTSRVLKNVTFEKEVTKKFCLKLDDPNNHSILEFKTKNHSNTSCGELKFVVYLPDGTKLKAAPSVQPGLATFYQVGTFKMNYTMKTNNPKCSTWDLITQTGSP